MHNHVANSGRKALLKQIFSVFLIFTLYFNSFNSAYASTYLGGWTITNKVMQGASLLIDATKTAVINGANVVKTSNAVIKPTASQVAKMIVKTGAVLAVDLAIKSLIGAVDYVMDNANNQVVYQPPVDPNLPTIPKIWTYQGYHQQVGVHSTANAACQASLPYISSQNPTYLIKTATVSNETATSATCVFRNEQNQVKTLITLNYINNPYYDPTAQEETDKKTIPYTTVAQEIIDQAETDQRAGAYVGDVANDLLANDAATQSDVETQLNTNAKTQTSEEAAAEATPKDPAAPDAGTNIKITFPVFCGWAPLVCEAAQSAIKFPTTVTNWWTIATTSISDAWTWTKARYEASVTSISDFFKNEPDQTDNTDLPVQEIPTPQLQTNAFTATAGCPEPIPIQIKIGVEGTAHISYEPICQFAEKWSFIAPLIGFLSGAMIIVGVGRKGEDSEI